MKFEYLITHNSKADHLSQLGKEGWELISVLPSYNGVNSVPDGREFYFKRILKE